jgi:hypothetical protein
MRRLIENAPDEKVKKYRQQFADRARERVVENVFPKIASHVAEHPRIVDQPPVLYHVSDPHFMEKIQEGLDAYRETLSDERRVLLDRYRLVDAALKVVGIGSVGTRCLIALMFSEENHPLILQIKESCRSVLAPYAGKSRYANQGQRVVMGQRLMQSSSDIFLGWARGARARLFVRQLRDMKLSIPIESVTLAQIKRYGAMCGQTLARAHAKSGDAATISGYLGKGCLRRGAGRLRHRLCQADRARPRGAGEGGQIRAPGGAHRRGIAAPMRIRGWTSASHRCLTFSR